MLRACRSSAQGPDRGPRGGAGGGGSALAWGLPWEDPRPLACHPGVQPRGRDGTKQETRAVLTGPRRGVQGKQNQSKPHTCPHTEGTPEETTLSGGYPRPVLSPSPPAWSRTGSGSGPGSETLTSALCSPKDSERNRQLNGHRAQTVGCPGSPQWGPASSLSVSPPCEGLACSPNPPRSHRWFGKQTESPGVHLGQDRGTVYCVGFLPGQDVVARGPRPGAPP